jgi:hypothetical protein
MYSLPEIQTAWQETFNPLILRQFVGNPEMGWKMAWSRSYGFHVYQHPDLCLDMVSIPQTHQTLTLVGTCNPFDSHGGRWNYPYGQ